MMVTTVGAISPYVIYLLDSSWRLKMKMDVKTGFGIIKDDKGNIVAKYELPEGEHPLKEDYTYEEAASREELEKIEIYQEKSIGVCRYCGNMIKEIELHEAECRKELKELSSLKK